jgi:hypothetical protein
VRAARGDALEAAAADVETLAFQALEERFRSALEYMRRYFDVDIAFVAVMRNRRLRVICERESTVLDASAALPAAIAEIVATGSTLILADAALHPSFSTDVDSLPGVRSFVGVPVVTRTGVVAGALCFGRRHVDPFPAEDVLLLEISGRRVALLVERVDVGEADPYRGIGLIALPRAVDREILEVALDMELRTAARRHDAVEVAVVDLGDEFAEKEADAIHAAVDPRRMALGVLGPRRIALFKRGATEAEASRAIGTAIEALRNVSSVVGVGAVAVPVADAYDGLGEMPPLLRFAMEQLARSVRSGHVERMLIRSGVS